MNTRLCDWGIHRPLTMGEHSLFWDRVSGLAVMPATCPCGKHWMTDGGRWFGHKLERKANPHEPQA